MAPRAREASVDGKIPGCGLLAALAAIALLAAPGCSAEPEPPAKAEDQAGDQGETQTAALTTGTAEAPDGLAKRPWQKEHRPNMTGTAEAYRPPGHVLAGGKRQPTSGD